MTDEKDEQELLRVVRVKGCIIRTDYDTNDNLLEALAAALLLVVGDESIRRAVRSNAAVLLAAIKFPSSVEELVHSVIPDPR